MEILSEIKNKISRHKKLTGNNPSKIFLTIIEEDKLNSLPSSHIGNRWSKFVEERGIRVLPRVLGMIPIWSSFDFRVE